MLFQKNKVRVSKAWAVIKNDGLITFNIKLLQKLQSKSVKPGAKNNIQFLVKYDDALKADWTISRQNSPTEKPSENKFDINWVMSPPGRGSGGHQNIFRFIRYLEQSGHTCRIYLYSTLDKRSVSEVRAILKDSYPSTKASIEWLKSSMAPADAVFATGWETAYPVFNSGLNAKNFYFVQDFEPFFYPMGSEYVLAENTYRFNFFGITAGGWLASKLNKEYKMNTDYYDFGADTMLYRYSNHRPRKEVFFYARPVTARRGFELGIMTLELFHRKHPEYTINPAGWDTSNYNIPFPHKNLKTLSLDQLSTLYNECSVALVLSLTNMSLLPLELLACGVIPVVNDGPNNRMVSDNPFIAYTNSSPMALANKMSEIIERTDLVDYAKKASESIEESNWEESGKKFVRIVEREIKNG